MIAIYILIILSVLFATGFLAAFVWSVRTGQYEDTCTPSLRLLTEEHSARSTVKLRVPHPTENKK
jgi:cbb3-type cytochrome oxidase maturation protein